MLKKIYCYISYLIFPFIAIILAKRKLSGKEDMDRFSERLGLASKKKNAEILIWFHGASVGEAVSMLNLINKILEKNNNVQIMVTTGTLTSAQLMKERLPKKAFHQYIPVDVPHYIKRFLEHFQPNAVFWFESEFWPNLIFETNKKNIPIILVNGRISNKSFKTWRYLRFFIKEILGCFSLCLGQSEQDAQRLKTLGAPNVLNLGNIKYSAEKLPVDKTRLKELKKAVANRKVWLAASTHSPEETLIAQTHQNLKADFADALTIIAPRHPQRGEEIANALNELGLTTKRRSQNELPEDKTDVYIADTLGELGIFYTLCDKVFIGGSLIPHGGQNILEPARFSCATIVGKYTHNFVDMIKIAKEKQAVFEVNDETELSAVLKNLFNDVSLLTKYGSNALSFAESTANVVDKVFEAVEPYIKSGKK